MTNGPEQNRAARLALHCPIRTNPISKLRQLWWLTLENRLLFNTTTFFRNTIFSSQPVFLCNHIVRCSQVHSHFTRPTDDSQMMLPSPKSNALKKTVIYCAINHWNNYPLNIQELNCKVSFENALCKCMSRERTYLLYERNNDCNHECNNFWWIISDVYNDLLLLDNHY